MIEPDEAFPASDPGNLLRAKMNGIVTPLKPKGFDEVLHTAQERGIISDLGMTSELALRVVHLYEVAKAMDGMPGDEAARIKL